MSEPKEHTVTTLGAVRVSALGISLFAVVAAGLIAVTHYLTQTQIQANIKEAQSRALFEIYPAEIDPRIFEHSVEVDATALNFEEPQVAYQARNGSQVIGVILPIRTLEGYSGAIDLLVGVNQDRSLSGVRVISHRETPGLGDNIELAKSDWILDFKGKVRAGADDPLWAVKKDGGQFDQFTGATITPRAIVNATATALNYVERHPELFRLPDSDPQQSPVQQGAQH